MQYVTQHMHWDYNMANIKEMAALKWTDEKPEMQHFANMFWFIFPI